jgi:hypothetical protein
MHWLLDTRFAEFLSQLDEICGNLFGFHTNLSSNFSTVFHGTIKQMKLQKNRMRFSKNVATCFKVRYDRGSSVSKDEEALPHPGLQPVGRYSLSDGG